MPLRKAFRDQRYYVKLLESLYSGLEGLDTSGYSFADSDRWTQCRTPGSWSSHLHFWVGFSDITGLDQDVIRQRCMFACALRYAADDDSVTQSRMQAAARDAMEYLASFLGPSGERVHAIEGVTFQPTEKASTYIECVIPFGMVLPR